MAHMGGYLERVRESLGRFMQGRVGLDELSRALVVAAVVLLVFDMLTGVGLFSLLGLACVVVAALRSLSRDAAKRARECDAYRRAAAKPKRWLALARKNWEGRKTTRYFTCPGCGCILSVPKGKGTLRITCPRCHAQTTRRS